MTAPMLLAAPFSMPSKVLAHKAPGGLLETFVERIEESTIVISDSAMVRATAWYFKRSDIYLVSEGELAYGLGYPRWRAQTSGRWRAESVDRRERRQQRAGDGVQAALPVMGPRCSLEPGGPASCRSVRHVVSAR